MPEQRFRRAMPRSPEWVTYHFPSRYRRSPELMHNEYLFVRSSKASSAIRDRFPQTVLAIVAFFCFLIAFLLQDVDPVESIGCPTQMGYKQVIVKGSIPNRLSHIEYPIWNINSRGNFWASVDPKRICRRLVLGSGP